MSFTTFDASLTDDPFDLDRIATIAARLDLRQPNREALESIALTTTQHFAIDAKPPPFEGVVDSATGVGKTYIMAAAIEYFAIEGVRNFAIITPGRTILDKTVANFTPGHPKSLLGGMETRPVVITSDNFNTAAIRRAGRSRSIRRCTSSTSAPIASARRTQYFRVGYVLPSSHCPTDDCPTPTDAPSASCVRARSIRRSASHSPKRSVSMTTE